MVLKLHSTEPQTHRIDNVAILRPCLPFSPYVDVLSPLPLLYVYYRVTSVGKRKYIWTSLFYMCKLQRKNSLHHKCHLGLTTFLPYAFNFTTLLCIALHAPYLSCLLVNPTLCSTFQECLRKY